MMRVFWEVLKDLWYFIYQESDETVNSTSNVTEKEVASMEEVQKFESPLSRPLIASEDKNGDLIGWAAYVQVDTAPYFSQPVLTVDTKLSSFFYGDKVMVIRTVNNFTEVRTTTALGWVDTEALTEDPHRVLPDLKPTYVYGADNEQTVKLRRFIQDEVLGGQLGLPLQSLEYVLSVLKINQVQVTWPSERPRLPGRWKTILRGVKGVLLSLEPHTGAILEYAGDTGISGFLGYVEAVHPDLSITLKSVGRVEEGEYRVEECSHNMWKEWRPVFISFI